MCLTFFLSTISVFYSLLSGSCSVVDAVTGAGVLTVLGWPLTASVANSSTRTHTRMVTISEALSSLGRSNSLAHVLGPDGVAPLLCRVDSMQEHARTWIQSQVWPHKQMSKVVGNSQDRCIQVVCEYGESFTNAKKACTQ